LRGPDDDRERDQPSGAVRDSHHLLYGRETVAQIIRTGLAELTAMAASSSRHFTREILLEYVCYWTIKRTALPEPMVREVLGCAGRWLDELYETLAHEHQGLLQDPDH